MDRVRDLLAHPLFRENLLAIRTAEADRIYCGHDLAHLMDVARIAWIMALERGIDLKKDLVYAAALLHDLGRAEEYAGGRSHDQASVQLARRILPDLGYRADEMEAICRAIEGHRGRDKAEGQDALAALLFEADKKSRACFVCPASGSCKWPENKKNTGFDY